MKPRGGEEFRILSSLTLIARDKYRFFCCRKVPKRGNMQWRRGFCSTVELYHLQDGYLWRYFAIPMNKTGPCFDLTPSITEGQFTCPGYFEISILFDTVHVFMFGGQFSACVVFAPNVVHILDTEPFRFAKALILCITYYKSLLLGDYGHLFSLVVVFNAYKKPSIPLMFLGFQNRQIIISFRSSFCLLIKLPIDQPLFYQ